MSDAPRLPPGYRLLAYERLGSSNDEAKRLAAAGAAAGTVVWALEQDAGRGRRGRAWVSPPGNLYCSLILRPTVAAAAAAQLSFAAALAVAEACEPMLPTGRRLRCKWPNDVLCDGEKLAGILLESEGSAEGRLDWLVIGVGINLAWHPAASERPATSLAALGAAPVAPADALSALIACFDPWWQRWCETGFAPIRAAWLARASGLGETIGVRLERHLLTGRFADLDQDGALLLDTAAGRRRIAAGEIFPAAAA